MGKREYTDEQYADVVTRYTKRHRRIHRMVFCVGLAGVVAAGAASYVLMHRAETMSEDGIDEMTMDDYIIQDDEDILDAALVSGGVDSAEEADPDAPLIEDAFGEEPEQAPDAFPADAFAALEETETEPGKATEEAARSDAEPEQAAASEVVPEDVAPVAEAESDISVAEPETAAPVAEAESEAPAAESETAVSVAESETEALTENIERFAQTEEFESESLEETETEQELLGSSQVEAVEKTAEDVYVETQGEEADPDWVQSVDLAIRDAEGLWSDAETEENTVVQVDADQPLRFSLTCTVEAGKLNQDMRTIIYHVPEEITFLTQSWGTIVDAGEKPLADYAVEENGTIRITFTEATAQLNEKGARITCRLEFCTTADALKQVQE